MDWSNLVDGHQYPLDAVDSAHYQEVVTAARRGLADNNCAVLPGFVKPEALSQMIEEAAMLVPAATFMPGEFNPYFAPVPTNVPDSHPLRRLSPRAHGMIRGDRFSEDGCISSLFHCESLCAFVADCLGFESLFPYLDPYGSVNVNVQPAGVEFAWHFDHNDFTVSVGLVQPGQGGVFEYVPNLRSKDDPNFSAVAEILDGDRTKVRSLTLQPGDLQLFKGGFTLHRVTAPAARRLSLLLSYTTQPNRVATPEYAERLWGEAHPLHYRFGGA